MLLGQVSEYFLYVLIFMYTLLFLSSAVYQFRLARIKSAQKRNVSIITTIRYVSSNAEALHLLQLGPHESYGQSDEVMLCRDVDSGIVRKLRSSFLNSGVKVFAPKKTYDLPAMIQQAYRKSKQGDVVLLLSSDVHIDAEQYSVLRHSVRAGLGVRLEMYTPNSLNVVSLTETFIKIAQQMCMNAGANIFKSTRALRLNCAYAKQDLLSPRLKIFSEWLYIDTTHHDASAPRDLRIDIIQLAAALIYLVSFILSASYAALTVSPVTLGTLWLITMGWLFVSMIAGSVPRNKTAALLGLPLAPVLLVAYFVVYPSLALGRRNSSADLRV